MPARFVLDVETDIAARAAHLRLTGPGGERLGEHRVELAAHPVARWEGLFEMRRYVRRVARDSRQAEVLLDTVGAFLGRSVLGAEITRALAAGEPPRSTPEEGPRTLLVRIAGDAADPLVAAFARVPWDIVRIEGDLRTLRERGFHVRVALTGKGGAADASTSIDAGRDSALAGPSISQAPGEPIRALLVFAEPGGPRPAGARIEREELLEAFYRDVLPHRDVEVDVLCHAVTRARLWDQVRCRGGYHLVHWSGRVVSGGLEIELEEGEEEPPVISGEELVDLLSGAGGEVTPALVLLCASRAGAIGVARDWDAVRAAMSEPSPAAAEPTLDHLLAGGGGTVGVGLSMLAAGVPAVVALRHEVAPSYARRLERAFYRRLLAGDAADVALAGAQRELAGGRPAPAAPAAPAAQPSSPSSPSSLGAPGSRERSVSWAAQGLRVKGAPVSSPAGSGRAAPSSAIESPSSQGSRAAGEPWQADLLDQSAPLLLGEDAVRICPELRRSALADRIEPRPQPLLESGSKDLDPAPGFIGRGVELGRLARAWAAPGGAPVALVEGPAGVGKTALAAEAIHLWHRDFTLVLAFRPTSTPADPAAPPAPGCLPHDIEALLRYVDRRLREESAAYRQRSEQDLLTRVYLPPGEPGEESRAERLVENLGAALRAERVLLVLDGLHGLGGVDPAEVAWGRLIGRLGAMLQGEDARVLVTARRCPPGLEQGPEVVRLPLGALPLGHTAVLADRRSALRDLLSRGTRERREGGGDAGQAERLARRLLEVSWGHPLVLLRLGDVAGMGRPVLEDALGRLGALDGGLPALPGGRGDAERARALLEDAGACVIDLLLERQSPGARRLLWGMSLAGEPVPAWMIEDLGATLLPGEERPRAALAELCAAGLLTREEEQARGTVYTFHELVAERVAAWVEQHPEERGDASAEDLYRCYGERYTAAFRNALPMLQQGLLTAAPVVEEPRAWSSPASSADARSRPPSSPGSDSKPRALRRPRELCAELGRRSVRYLVRARAFQALSTFASAALTGAGDAGLVADVIADLIAAADHGVGAARWRARVSLADALRGARHVDAALPLYRRAAADAAADDHWADLGVIFGKWATALAQDGRLDEARALYERAADAKRRAGKPLAQVLGAELDALRIDVMRDAAAEALPAIESRVASLRELWAARHRAEGAPPPMSSEAPSHGAPRAASSDGPDDAQLAGAFTAGLDIARRANAALGRWDACLSLLDELEALDRELGVAELEISRERFHRWTPLARLGRTAEATEVIEGCLDGFRRARDTRGEVRALSALASVRAEQGDLEKATELEREALAARERFASPSERAGAHCRVAAFLHRAGHATEAMDYALAAIAYQLASGQEAWFELRELAAHALAAEGTSTPPESGEGGTPSGARTSLLAVVPRLASLFERAPFAPLRRFLGERAASVEALQARIDELLASAAAGLDRGRAPAIPMAEAE